ncbi:MAG: Serine/threonine-protein kinase pkn1 [candidate division BRC1 bacterium ADurb.BinA364]|nr:MAG: Serine/threonine-protein kinase pkn1 [candidate division BRC1 bacterium ADurb.BinA364]
MPTEAQWEYACRAGSSAAYPWGAAASEISRYANALDAHPATVDAGCFEPNAFGLHDMIGNVWEWCADYYAPGYFAIAPDANPVNLQKTDRRSIRGGAFDSESAECRAAHRRGEDPWLIDNRFGFRVALNSR